MLSCAIPHEVLIPQMTRGIIEKRLEDECLGQERLDICFRPL